MMKLFNKLGGNSIISVIVMISLLSLTIFCFLNSQVIFNEVSRNHLAKKQVELLSKYVFEDVNTQINKTERLSNKLYTFDKNSQSSSRWIPLDNDVYYLKITSSSKNATDQLGAYYVKANKDDSFSDALSVDLYEGKFGKKIDYDLKDKDQIIVSLNKKLPLGEKGMIKKKGSLFITSNVSLKLFTCYLKSPVTVTENFGLIGNLVLDDELDCYKRIFVDGDIITTNKGKITANEGIFLTGKILKDGKELDNYDDYIQGEVKKIDSNKKDCYYFLGFESKK